MQKWAPERNRGNHPGRPGGMHHPPNPLSNATGRQNQLHMQTNININSSDSHQNKTKEPPVSSKHVQTTSNDLGGGGADVSTCTGVLSTCNARVPECMEKGVPLPKEAEAEFWFPGQLQVIPGSVPCNGSSAERGFGPERLLWYCVVRRPSHASSVV